MANQNVVYFLKDLALSNQKLCCIAGYYLLHFRDIVQTVYYKKLGYLYQFKFSYFSVAKLNKEIVDCFLGINVYTRNC